MKNEAIVSVCGDIALKFLEITLPQNIQFFDNYIIISDSKSKGVHEFCQKWPVTLLISDEFYRNGARFNRGRVYNQAFQILDFYDWVTLLDADVYISDKLGAEIKNTNYDIQFMWGARRLIVPKYKDFLELLKGNKEFEDSLQFFEGTSFGFHQMFNCKADSIKRQGLIYDESFCGAEEDWRFRNRLFGDLTNDDKDCVGNLKKYYNKIYHLGQPNILGGKNFFIA